MISESHKFTDCADDDAGAKDWQFSQVWLVRYGGEAVSVIEDGIVKGWRGMVSRVHRKSSWRDEHGNTAN
jgi:hypothetical protein